jgi:murein hydrolase activator
MNRTLVGLILFFVFNSSFSQQKDYLEKKRKETLSEIEKTHNILNELNKNKVNSIEKLKLIEKQIENRSSLLNGLSGEIEEKDRQISEQQVLISSIEKDVETIKAMYAKLIFIAYKKHRKGNFISYIFSAKTFGQAYKRLMYIKQYSYFRKKQLETINEIRTSLSLKKRELEIFKTNKQQLLKNKEEELVNLSSEKKSQKSEFDNLLKKESVLKKELAEKVRIANRLQREVEALIKSELEVKKSVVPKVIAENKVLSGNFKDNRGKLPWPTDRGVIIAPFGEQRHPVLKGVVVQNNGIDISTNSNAKVYTVFEGEVKRVFSFLGANYTVIVRHGEYLTLYQNLSVVSVKPGDKIRAKQEIGFLYSSSDSKTSLLHLEIWEESNKLNPEVWLSKN